jgi:hypothetical protein
MNNGIIEDMKAESAAIEIIFPRHLPLDSNKKGIKHD